MDLARVGAGEGQLQAINPIGLLLAAVTVLAGCNMSFSLPPPSFPSSSATALSPREKPYAIDMPSADHIDFNFSDKRPNELKKPWSDSQEEPKGQFAVIFYGDADFSPPVPDIFRSYLAANLNQVLSGKTVTLTDFSVVARAENPVARCEKEHPNNPDGCYGNGNPMGDIVVPFVVLTVLLIEPVSVTVNMRSSVDAREFTASCSEQFRTWISQSNMQSLIVTCLQKIGGDMKAAYTQQ